MRRKCDTCLCRTCMVVCCDRKNCPGKKESCERYSGFRQLSISEQPSKPPYNSISRHSWQHYGISKNRYRQLTEYIHSGKYSDLYFQAAHAANETIAKYILLSVTQNKSYDVLRVKWELKEMERIPYCRTDFYGIRRYFYHIFDEKLKEIGK